MGSAISSCQGSTGTWLVPLVEPRPDVELDEPELVATLRQLVQAVVVHAPPGTDELAIEIKASLSELTLPGPLLKRSSGG